MEKISETVSLSPKKDAFVNVALWQFMAFGLLLAFVWANEVLDLSYLVFGAEESAFSLYRACIISAAVITAGVVAVGHTYEQQRRLVKQILMTCLYCHRVKTDKGKWMHVEEYFVSHYPVATDRVACPDCQKMLKSVEELQGSSAQE